MGVKDNDLGSLSDDGWLERIAGLAGAKGGFSRLGDAHAALFVPSGRTLLVTFETRRSIRARDPGQMPVGLTVARSRKWSLLCMIAQGDTWYRDRDVYAHFDRLVDLSFFEEFDQVVFYGAGMAGYAACAYSVTAPGATVIAVQPQATLDPRLTGWDPRFSEHRRLSFTDRYGYAPDMTEGAGTVYVIFDPEQTLDAMHAALFARPWVRLLPCRNLGRDIGGALEGMTILPAMLTAAGNGTFDEALFRSFYRSRRNYEPYLRSLSARLDTDGRAMLNGILCRNIVNRLGIEAFRTRLIELEAELRRAGESLPRGRG